MRRLLIATVSNLALAGDAARPLVTADLRLMHTIRASRFAKRALPLSELGVG